MECTRNPQRVMNGFIVQEQHTSAATKAAGVHSHAGPEKKKSRLQMFLTFVSL